MNLCANSSLLIVLFAASAPVNFCAYRFLDRSNQASIVPCGAIFNFHDFSSLYIASLGQLSLSHVGLKSRILNWSRALMRHSLEFDFFLVVDIIVVICDRGSLVIGFLFLAAPCTSSTILAISLLYGSSNENTLFASSSKARTFLCLLLRLWLMNFLRFYIGPLTVHSFVIWFRINYSENQ